ncbi:hypothetical protein P9112_013011 [Eukaryota sp. TZLM1-RC]
MSLRALNRLLSSTYADIESLTDGIAFIRCLDSKLPGLIDLRSMSGYAASQTDKLKNLTLLCNALPGAFINPQKLCDSDENELRRVLKIVLLPTDQLKELVNPPKSPEIEVTEDDSLTTDQASHLSDLIVDLSKEINARKEHLKESEQFVSTLIGQRDELFAKLQKIEKYLKSRRVDKSDSISQILKEKPSWM